MVQFLWHPVISNGKMYQAALGLRTPVMIGWHVDDSHGIAFLPFSGNMESNGDERSAADGIGGWRIYDCIFHISGPLNDFRIVGLILQFPDKCSDIFWLFLPGKALVKSQFCHPLRHGG